MVSTRKKIFIVVLIYIVVSLFFWIFSDNIAEWGMNANPFLATLVNFLTNPFYIGSLILIIELFFRGYKLNRTFFNYLRVIIASILFSLAVDITSIIHSFKMDFTIPNELPVSIYFDTVIGKLMQSNFPNGYVGTFFLYVVIPSIMVILALFIASPKKFLGIVKEEFGYG